MAFRRGFLVLVIAVMALGMVGSPNRSHAQVGLDLSLENVESECDNGWFDVIDSSQILTSQIGRGGRSITLVNRLPEYMEGDNLYVFAVDGAGHVLGDWSGFTEGPGTYPGGIDYNTSTPVSPVTFHLFFIYLFEGEAASNSSINVRSAKLARPVFQPSPPIELPGEWDYMDSVSVPVDCGGVPTSGGIGCDLEIYIPEGSVMGRFVQTTRVYWAPGQLMTNPALEMPAGKTAIVIGQDATHQYYKFVWGCNYLWAPVETLGPAVGDANWMGRPLPTREVK